MRLRQDVDAFAGDNPLFDKWAEIVSAHYVEEQRRMAHFDEHGEFPHREFVDVLKDPFISAFSARHDLAPKYAWAVPSDEALSAIIEHSPQGVVEIGAGSGYWAWLLRERSVDVVAYDRKPYHNAQVDAKWSLVKRGGPWHSKLFPERTLFLCWPPYAHSMAFQALSYYQGQTLAYIGEGEGGCTGDDQFHSALEKEWEEIQFVGLPQWPGIHDNLVIYRRLAGIPERRKACP